MCDSDEYPLFVNDLPIELDKQGLYRIFSRFGTVKSVIALENVKFAFVTYSTYGEAEAAINGLDNKPPLYLKITFRKQKGENVSNGSPEVNGMQLQVANDGTQQDFRYSKPTISKNSSIQYKNLSQIKLPKIKLSANQYHIDPNGYVPNQNGMTYNPYDDLDYASTSAMWSRGCLSIDAAGRRHVSMGRGHIFYHIPNPYPSIEDHIGKVYEIRNPGCYRCGVDKLQSHVGKCMLCARDAILLCASCDGYYCTRECQIADWPKHKKECSKLSSTITMNGYSKPTLPVKSISELTSGNDQNLAENSKQRISSKSIRRSQSVQHEKSMPPRMIEHSVIHDSNNCKNIDTTENNNSANHNNTQIRMLSSLPETMKNSTIDLTKSSLSGRFKNMKVIDDDEDNFVFKRPTFLSKSNFIEVNIVAVLQPGIYSVQKLDDIEALIKLMKNLNATINKMPVVSKLNVGGIYATTYDGIWHRALILSTNPLKVDYIDYGTIEEVGQIEFRDLGELAAQPRFSRIIKLPPSAKEYFKNLIEECTIKVKMIDVNDDGSINVELRNEDEKVEKKCESSQVLNVVTLRSPPRSAIVANSKVVPSKSQENEEYLPCIVDILDTEIGNVFAYIAEKIDDFSATAVLIFKSAESHFESLINPLKRDCEAALLKYKNYRPQINDLVCAKKDDEFWVRGRVIEISPTLKIASFDEGLYVETVQAIPMLSQYKEIYTFAAVITIESNNSRKFSLETNSEIPFKVVAKQVVNGETVIKGELLDELKGIKVNLKKWVGPCTQKKITPKLEGAVIRNKSQVTILAHRGPSIVFLRSLDEDQVDCYGRLTQDVAKSSQTAKKLLSLPSPGDLVLAKYIDDNYYRALVLALDDNDIKIGYIDYGNNEVTSLEKLKEMPQSLKERPRVSARVTLKGIKNIPPTKETIEYLGMLAAKETTLICTFDKTIDDGVTLTSTNGESVNDFINDLMTPSFEKNTETDSKDMNYLRLADMEMSMMGHIGDTIDACFLDTLQSGYKYVFAPLDNELILYISRILPELLKQYALSAEKYIPRINELCIALYEDGWYRGCCVKPSLSPTSAEIYFVDFGNVSQVLHKDIRAMPKDYLKPAPLGSVCTIPDLTPSSSELLPKLQTKLNDLLIPNETYRVKLLQYNDMNWQIDLPQIRKQLIAEGLISS